MNNEFPHIDPIHRWTETLPGGVEATCSFNVRLWIAVQKARGFCDS